MGQEDPSANLPTASVPHAGACAETADATWDAQASPGSPTPAPPIYAERYQDMGRLASGSTGEVRRVLDLKLSRPAVIKLLFASRVGSPDHRERFATEARRTARLQHPGVVSIHDQGELEDGRLWFVMQEVRGQTLAELLASRPWTERRLLECLLRVTETVAYAHSEGVVHRDLKPQNVMIGPFGEVLVLDWGLARNLAEDGEGRVLGTPRYMSPEQARGETAGPPSDVYGLGAMLYEVLSGQPPYGGAAMSAWQQVLAGPPQPLGALAPQAPAELVRLCERAMDREPDRRPPHAGALARELQAWLDAAHRRDRAQELLDSARARQPQLAGMRAQVRALLAQAERLRDALKPYDAPEAKRPLWACEDLALALRQQLGREEVEWEQLLQGALNLVPEQPEALALLAEHHRERLIEAEAAGEPEAAARAEALLRVFDRGQHAPFLAGWGELSLETDAPGAWVHVLRFVEQDRCLFPEHRGTWGPTPLCGLPLPRGSYLLLVEAEGMAPQRCPVRIERGGGWDRRPPGEARPRPLRLLPQAELGPQERLIPAGWCQVGGDPQATQPLPSARVWLEDFVMMAAPVTVGDYLRWLDWQVALGQDPAEDLPRAPLGGSQADPLQRGADGRYRPAPEQGDWAVELPMVRISWAAATRYAEWRAAESGLPWRLPTELEWEKAARGVDGRAYPWGQQADPAYFNNLMARPGPPSRSRAGDFPLDLSPYGIYDLGGNVRSWTSDSWGGDLALRVVRGGAWSANPAQGRAASRFAGRVELGYDAVGLWLVRSLDPRP